MAKPVTGFLDPKSSEAKIEIFPNPAMDQLTIRMPNDEWDQCQIKILNMAGKCVYQHVRGSFPSGTQTLTLDLPQLPSGTYKFILRADNRKLESKTFIVH
ncbi:MAG: T9SS type A sorting domain-containing protein [Saprospiraceae bacterium]|nr:T9SS type A sorting domain-containing protein [Saprospiraceae bacterium]